MNYTKLYGLALLLSSTSFALAATTVDAKPAIAPQAIDTATLAHQLETLKKQLSTLEARQKAAEEAAAQKHTFDAAKINIIQANAVSAFPDGYIALPNTNSAIKISGRVKIDAAYYPNANGDVSAAGFRLPALPLNDINNASSKTVHFGGTVQGSRLAVDSLSRTAMGDLGTRVEVDFYGIQNGSVFSTTNGGATTTLTQQSSPSTDYGIRIRQAYLTFQSWTVGQIETNFLDVEPAGYCIDNVGVMSVPRRMQVRFSTEVAFGLKIHLSAEKANTDYMDSFINTRSNESFGNSSLPDFTARLRYDSKMGYISTSAIARTLGIQIKSHDPVVGDGNAEKQKTITDFSTKRLGWGIAMSGGLHAEGSKSTLFGLVSYGRGIGSLYSDGSPSGYLQFPIDPLDTSDPLKSDALKQNWASSFSLITSFTSLLGYRHFWSDAFRTTIAGTFTKMSNPKSVPVQAKSAQANTQLTRFFVNAIYSPTPNMDIAFEIMYGVRRTLSGATRDATTGAPTGAFYNGSTARLTQTLLSMTYRF